MEPATLGVLGRDRMIPLLISSPVSDDSNHQIPENEFDCGRTRYVTSRRDSDTCRRDFTKRWMLAQTRWRHPMTAVTGGVACASGDFEQGAVQDHSATWYGADKLDSSHELVQTA